MYAGTPYGFPMACRALNMALGHGMPLHACNSKCNTCNKQSLLCWKLHSHLSHLNLMSLKSSLNLTHKYVNMSSSGTMIMQGST